MDERQRMQVGQLKRREFISLLGGAAASWPLAARAQQRTEPLIGYLSGGAESDSGRSRAGFRQGLQDVGFIEGQNVSVEYQFAENQPQRLPELAADLVRRRPAVIVAVPNQAAINAAKAATATIPIVFNSGPDPVKTGLVASLNRPGGNLTGVTQLSSDLTAKRVGLLHDTIPQVTAFAMLLSPATQTAPVDQLMLAQTAGRGIGVKIFPVEADAESEFEAAFASAAAGGAGAILISTNIFLTNNRERLVALAAKYKLPAIYQTREYPVAGGLMSYGPSSSDVQRQVGRYAGRILKGEKPADLPVLLPTTFDFVINLKTSKALGLAIPPGVLAIATEIIE
jgi:putative ABC transport system substrate-binding protein